MRGIFWGEHHSLGPGSPNTVVRLLDAWWAALGQRLATHEAKLALPDAVVAAASQLWLTALAEAKTLASNALAAEQATLAQEHQALEAAMVDAREQTAAAGAARQQVETRRADLERPVAIQSLQLADLQAQRVMLQPEREVLSTQVSELLEVTEPLRTDSGDGTTRAGEPGPGQRRPLAAGSRSRPSGQDAPGGHTVIKRWRPGFRSRIGPAFDSLQDGTSKIPPCAYMNIAR